MQKFKEIIMKLLFPRTIVIILSSLVGFPAVIISRTKKKTNPVCYISYILSAYSMTVLCTNFPRAKRRCRELIHGDEIKIIVNFRLFMNRYKYTSMYLNSPEFRARISLYSGLIINLFYAVFKCATGIIFRSAWFWTIGIYYVMLSAIRFTLLRNVRLTDKKEYSSEKKFLSIKAPEYVVL